MKIILFDLNVGIGCALGWNITQKIGTYMMHDKNIRIF